MLPEPQLPASRSLPQIVPDTLNGQIRSLICCPQTPYQTCTKRTHNTSFDKKRKRERERDNNKQKQEKKKKKNNNNRNKVPHPIIIIFVFGMVVFWLFFIILSLPCWRWSLSPSFLVPCSSLPSPLFRSPEQISLISPWK